MTFGWLFGDSPARPSAFQYTEISYGSTFVKSVAIYDSQGHIVASIHIDSDNNELDVHIAEGYWASGDGQLRAKESMTRPTVNVNGQAIPVES